MNLFKKSRIEDNTDAIYQPTKASKVKRILCTIMLLPIILLLLAINKGKELYYNSIKYNIFKVRKFLRKYLFKHIDKQDAMHYDSPIGFFFNRSSVWFDDGISMRDKWSVKNPYWRMFMLKYSGQIEDYVFKQYELRGFEKIYSTDANYQELTGDTNYYIGQSEGNPMCVFFKKIEKRGHNNKD